MPAGRARARGCPLPRRARRQRGKPPAGRLALHLESTPHSASPRTKWTRRVPHPVLIGHAASLIRSLTDNTPPRSLSENGCPHTVRPRPCRFLPKGNASGLLHETACPRILFPRPPPPDATTPVARPAPGAASVQTSTPAPGPWRTAACSGSATPSGGSAAASRSRAAPAPWPRIGTRRVQLVREEGRDASS